MRKTLGIAVGGTGGHVIPAEEIGRRLSKNHQVIYLGVALSKNRFFNGSDCTVFDVDGGNFARGILSGATKIGKGFFQAREILKREGVSHVLGFGSFHSLPPMLAAATLRIPYSLVETNVIPGKVNRLLAPFASETYITFEGAKGGKTTLVDYLFKEEKESLSREEARAFFGLDPHKETLLIFGGSQGAAPINKAVVTAMEKLGPRFQVIHFTGKEEGSIREAYARLGIAAYVTDFSREAAKGWIASDLAICRAGAGALREMLIYERGAILIPYPHAANNHQHKNALFLESIGGAKLIVESRLDSTLLANQLDALFASPNRPFEQMQRILAAHKHSEQREPIVRLIEQKFL